MALAEVGADVPPLPPVSPLSEGQLAVAGAAAPPVGDVAGAPTDVQAARAEARGSQQLRAAGRRSARELVAGPAGQPVHECRVLAGFCPDPQEGRGIARAAFLTHG